MGAAAHWLARPERRQLDGILNSIREIQKQLDTLGPDVAGGSPIRTLQDPSFRALMQTLRHQATSLPPAVGRIVSQIADAPEGAVISGATTVIQTLYNQQVVPTCNSLIANRYPFASSATDVQLADFGLVFGYDGLFDKFFTEHLEKQVDTTGPAWRWRPGSVNLPDGLLDQFQEARRIRDMFFPPGAKMPDVRFFVTFGNLDAAAQRAVLQIDGQTLDDKHMKQAGHVAGTHARPCDGDVREPVLRSDDSLWRSVGLVPDDRREEDGWLGRAAADRPESPEPLSRRAGDRRTGAGVSEPVRDGRVAAIQLRVVNRRCR